MSMKEFNLRIKLGNTLMSEGVDVAGALRDLADRLEDRTIKTRDSFTVLDRNGNTVGNAQVDRVGAHRISTSPYYDRATTKVTGAQARMALVEIGTALGSLLEWSDAPGLCASIAEIVTGAGDLPRVSDQRDEDLDFWADIAEELGWEHDREEPEYDGDPDAEMDAREDED